MFYTIYKTTNTLNGKYYIGKHQTLNPNDDYLGSGKRLRYAIKKYGRENFIKSVLFIFDNEADMNAKEKELVVLAEDSYNLCEGGHGGFGYINRRIMTKDIRSKAGKVGGKIGGSISLKLLSFEERSNRMKVRWARGYTGSCFTGKKHSQETKAKMAEKAKLRIGSKNSQFGSYWITDGVNSKKIAANSPIPNDWYRGRRMNKDI